MAPSPCRYWRIIRILSSGVVATTLTQGRYSLTQYSGITVPLGSWTRSRRTVYQNLRETYSEDRTFQGRGSSGGGRAIVFLWLRFYDSSRLAKDPLEHFRGQLAGVGVLPAGMVRAEQQRRADAPVEGGAATVRERR